MPFRIALSGLDAASTDLKVSGHNIANASTTGFKESRAEFADLYATSLQDVSATSSGSGVRVSRVAQQFSQGSIDFTGNSLDLSITGEGFFIVEDANGTPSYTRAGAFSVDRDGYVVNHAGDTLQVFSPIPNTNSFNTGSTVDMQLPALSGAPSATTSVTAALNMDASETVPAVAFNVAAPAPDQYNHSTSTTIYDSLGSAHTQTMYYRKVAPNQWNAYTYVDGTNVTVGGSAFADIQFDTAGALRVGIGDVSPTGTVVLDPLVPGGGAAALNITFDYNSATQYGSGFAVNDLTQDGFSSGRLSGMDIDSSGVIFARYTNGQSDALGKIALARFNNQQGLRQVGDTSWAETFSSGDVQIGEAGTSSFGLMQSGALEVSNVDIAEQLVNLITAQRNYQANSQVITTADTITQTIINLR